MAKCESSGDLPKAWKCKPIKAARNGRRKVRNAWKASKKPQVSSLAPKKKKKLIVNITFSSKHSKIKISQSPL